MKLRLKRFITPTIITWFALAVATFGLLSYKLATLLPGLAKSEVVLPHAKDSLHTIWNQPLELPAAVSRLLVAALLPTGGISASRLPSVLLGLLVVALAYWLLKRWYGPRLAIFGSALLITAPWFLHTSRLATNAIVYPLAMIGVLVLSALWHQKQRPIKLVYFTAVTGAILLYIPGALWLIICVAIFERKNLLTSLKTGRLHTAYAGVLGLITLIPLIHAFINDGHMFRAMLGIPSTFTSLLDYPMQFIQVWQHIFVGGYNDPIYNLGGLPIINVLVGLAFIVGIYLYAQHPKASRSRLLLSLWLIGTLLVTLQGPVSLMLLLPIVLVVATGGIGYLLHLWLRIFPRNPIARGFGISMIGLVIVFAVLYNVNNYYQAWPGSPTTKAAFQQQP